MDNITVSRIMGHSRPDTTLKVYQHVTGKQAAEVIEKLPSALKKRHGNEKGRPGEKNNSGDQDETETENE